MSAFKFLATVVLLFSGVLSKVSAQCADSCPEASVCDAFDEADAVVLVKPVGMADIGGTADGVIYTLETVEVFKAEEPGPNEYDDVGATFNMAFGDNGCGYVLLPVNSSEEWLMDMTRGSNDTLRAVGICGLVQQWIPEVEQDLRGPLEGGCENFQTSSPTASPTPAPSAGGSDTSGAAQALQMLSGGSVATVAMTFATAAAVRFVLSW